MTTGFEPEWVEGLRFCPHCGSRGKATECTYDGHVTVPAVKFDPNVIIRPGDVLAGRYRLTAQIAKGGYGSIYAGEHVVTGQEVAIKVLKTDFGGPDDGAIRRFFREARVTASLKHPNTIRVFDVGQAPGGAFFLAMEMLKGPTLEQILTERLAQGRALTEPETIDLAIPVLRSLGEAHALGLVHRDMKPSNIILADFGDGEPVVKLVDFGIAWMHGSSLTTTGMALGTPAYMSPEQCEAAELDGRSDIYAFGILLYRCLAGDVPYRQSSAVAIMQSHLRAPVPDVRKAALSPVTDAFNAVLQRALAKRPEDRFAKAADMRKALEAVRDAFWPDAPEGTISLLESVTPLTPPQRITGPHGLANLPPPHSSAITATQPGSLTGPTDTVKVVAGQK
jgi:serine/threonine-protein kinase